MPRIARIFSSRGIYHITCRGIGRQILFEEASDYEYYLHLLQRYKEDIPYDLLAYCLMDNHVHLLMLIPEKMDLLMKKISISYAYYFNGKYDRCGHLFQDRYRSEPIEDDYYLLSAARYIHNNPPAVGICDREQYQWSSYGEYWGKANFVCPDLVLQAAGGRDAFLAFSGEDDVHEESEAVLPLRLDDQAAKKRIEEILGKESGTVLQKMDKAGRNKIIRTLRAAGLSVRQMERLTGIPRGIVQKAGKR